MKKHLFYIGLLLLLCFGCNPKKSKLFQKLDAAETGVDFSNKLSLNDTFNAVYFEYVYNGGGVAIGDINNDDLPDLFFTGNMVSSRLYLNKGDLQFEDISAKAGIQTEKWCTGVSFVDINQDGYTDIYVSVAGYAPGEKMANMLFINNGNATFTERAAAYGLADSSYSTQAAFLDYDQDGDLDMYLLNNALEEFNRNTSRPIETQGKGKSTDKLYRNNGDNTFSDVSLEAGVTMEGWGLGISIVDINMDGWPDIYVSNDFLSNDLLYINQKDGSFSNDIASYLNHQSYNGMGNDVADFNNDGLMDIVVMDMLPEGNYRRKTMLSPGNYDRFMFNLKMGYQPQYIRNTLQLNNGNDPNGHPSFSEIGQLAGISNTDWSWSALFADYDNDGLKDLFISNGYRKDITNLDYIVYNDGASMFGAKEDHKREVSKELEKLKGVHIHNYIYKNKGDLSFEDMSVDWGLEDPSYSNGAAYADLDNDGDLDLVINNLDQPAALYRNRAEKLPVKNNFLQVILEGDSKNRKGLGAKIWVHTTAEKQYYEHYLVRGYKSTVDSKVHFGLGKANRVEALKVLWPDGKSQILKNLKANQTVILRYVEAEDQRVEPSPAVEDLLFQEISADMGLAFVHEEDDHVDFKQQRLLPHKYSQDGPGLAVGDVNGDGLEDFYIGSSSNKPGYFFIQDKDGRFTKKEFQLAHAYEEMGVLLFDADNDGDLDLYAVSGGSEFPEGSSFYQDQLYVNNGKGEFTVAKNSLPNITSSGSCVTAADYDQDGDLDLFIGGSAIISQYPYPSESYILNNENGQFKDVTNQIDPSIKKIGIVTAALWSDFNNDNMVDLLIAGEWMPVTFFKNENGKFTNITKEAGMDNYLGWWNSLNAGDFDNDGDIDYIAGNLGENNKYKVSDKHPVCIYAKDYDKNGSIDPVMCYYIDGKNYPEPPRDLLIDQIAAMKGRFIRYDDYARATFDQVFTEKELNGAYVVKSNYFTSSYIENKGNHTFEISPLPVRVQFSPVFGTLVEDYDQDGNLDIITIGNSYATDIRNGWYDASVGVMLHGLGNGKFEPVSPLESGFYVKKDAKALGQVLLSNGKALQIATQNRDSLKAYAMPDQPGFITSQPGELYADLLLKDGKRRKQEFYLGAGYLSQSSQLIKLTPAVASITIKCKDGTSRTVDIGVIP